MGIFDPSGNGFSNYTATGPSGVNTGGGSPTIYGSNGCNGAFSGGASVTITLNSGSALGDYTVAMGQGAGGCGMSTLSGYISCEDANNGHSLGVYSFISNAYNYSLQRIIDQATSTFDQTTDPPLTSFLGWAVSNFYLLFLGSGLAVLYTLRGWIVAMIMIGAIIYFAYRLFKFFRH